LNAGDLDGDGKPELLITDSGNRILQMVRVARDWSRQSTLLDDLTVDETSVTGLDIADLDGDGDGRAELIYAGGQWTRYDIRVARLEHGALRLIARAQVGLILGLAAADLDGDGKLEIVAAKSHGSPNPRLFDDDPYLGPGGPLILHLAGDRLEQTWSDPLIAPNARQTELRLLSGCRTTGLGPVFVVGAIDGMLHLYFGRPGRAPLRRDLRLPGFARHHDDGVVVADLDGDGTGELVLGGARISAYGIGQPKIAQRREHSHPGMDWLSTARQLREADEIELALSAYRAAAAQGADAATVAYEEGLCHARAERWQTAVDRFREARAAGRHDVELLRSLRDAAEAVADWRTALEAARELGDHARVAALEAVLEMTTAFAQNFVDPWPAWHAGQPLACRGRTADGAIGLDLFPGDRGLDVPIDWDGSSLEASAVVALRDIQYGKGFQITISQGDQPWIGGGIRSGGGGGDLFMRVYLVTRGISSVDHIGSTPGPVDWSQFPAGVRLTLSYVAAVNEWQVALYDLGGNRLDYARGRAETPPRAGRYLLRLSSSPPPTYLAASVVDLYRFELRAAPGALTIVASDASQAPPRCARDPGASASPVQRAFALASAGRIVEAARVLADWRPAAAAQDSPWGFEFDAYQPTEWEAGLVRLALLDEPLTSAVVEAGKLMPRRDWASCCGGSPISNMSTRARPTGRRPS
jgi:tetratricopeptide (TPR) repeat protein